MRALLAHRAEQEAAEASEPTRPDDEQVGAVRLVDEDPRRGSPSTTRRSTSTPCTAPGGNRRALASSAASAPPGDRPTRRRLGPAGLDSGRVDVAEPPCVHGPERCVTQPRFAEGEAECSLRAVRGVDADNDQCPWLIFSFLGHLRLLSIDNRGLVPLIATRIIGLDSGRSASEGAGLRIEAGEQVGEGSRRTSRSPRLRASGPRRRSRRLRSARRSRRSCARRRARCSSVGAAMP